MRINCKNAPKKLVESIKKIFVKCLKIQIKPETGEHQGIIIYYLIGRMQNAKGMERTSANRGSSRAAAHQTSGPGVKTINDKTQNYVLT